MPVPNDAHSEEPPMNKKQEEARHGYAPDSCPLHLLLIPIASTAHQQNESIPGLVHSQSQL